jgi:hypothetical protein
MSMKKSTTKIGVFALVAILAVSTVVVALSQSAIAAPANKSAFGDDTTTAVLNSSSEPGLGNFETIVAGTIKTSSPSDLLVRHDQECAIYTGLNLDKNNEELTSAIREDVRLKVTGADGVERFINPVPLGDEGTSSTETDSTSDVSLTMCGRAYGIDTNILSTIADLCDWAAVIEGQEVCPEAEPYFKTFISTKATHGWSWVVPNMGPGVHTIEVQAMLVNELAEISNQDDTKTKGPNSNTDSTCKNNAGADCTDTILAVGNKSLIITEEKFSSSVE